MSVAARAGGGKRTTAFGLLGDERLARLAAAGHTRAFAVVYERHHQALYRYCRSILRHDADAQDALQSAFAAAFAALRRGQRDAPIRPWLFRIAHNEAVSVLRRRRPTADLSAASDWSTASVEDQVAERAELDTLLRDLRELNDRQRSALVMRELSGLSHEEIAIALDTSVGAAKQTIYEARRSLFEFAEGRGVPCDEIRRMISDADGRLLRSRRVRAHLRDCSGCTAFAVAIPERGRDLRALVPALPTVVATGMLERVAGAGAAHGTGSGVSVLATGAAGKAAGSALAANALAGIAVVASATVAVTVGVDKLAHASHQAGSAPTPAVRSPAPEVRTPGSAVLSPAAHPPRRSGSPPGSRVVRSAPGARRAAAATPGHRTVAPPAALHSEPAPSTAPGSSPVPPALSTPAPGVSTSAPAATTPATTSAAPGHSGAAPGHTTSSAAGPGKSAAAPGHSTSSTTAPGHAGAAPGHSSASTGTTPGNSASAPGHASTTSTAPGHSGSAPGHSGSAPGHSGAVSGQSATVPAVAPVTATAPTVATTPQVPPATPPGAAVSARHEHLSRS